MKCRECRTLISHYLGEQLDESRRVAMESHLADCPGCRTQVEEMRAVTHLLRDLPAPAPKPGFVEQVVSAAISLNDSEKKSQATKDVRPAQKRAKAYRPGGIRSIAVGASLLVVLGAVWLSGEEEAVLMSQPSASSLPAVEASQKPVDDLVRITPHPQEDPMLKDYTEPEPDLEPAPEAVATAWLLENGYVKTSEGWLTSEAVGQKKGGRMMLEGRWVEPSEIAEQWLSRKGYVRSAEGWKIPGANRAPVARAVVEQKSQAPASKENLQSQKSQSDGWQEWPTRPKALTCVPFGKAERLRWANRVQKTTTKPLAIEAHFAPISFKGPRAFTGWVVQASKASLGTPAIVGERVYIGTGVWGEECCAFDVADGRLLWRSQLPGRGCGNPIVADQRLMIVLQDGRLVSLDPHSGAESWGWHLAQRLESLPAVTERWVIQSLQHEQCALLTAYEAERGEFEWHAELPAVVWGRPCIAGERAFVTTARDGAVHALDLETGHPLWAANIHALSSPVMVQGDRLLVRRVLRRPLSSSIAADGKSEMAEVLSLVDAKTGKLLRATVGPVEKLGVSDRKSSRSLRDKNGTLAWNPWQAPGYFLAPPIVRGNVAFILRDELLQAVDWQAGRLLWQRRVGSTQGDRVHSDPVLAGPFLLLGTLAGKLWCFDAKDGRPLWDAQVSAPLGGPCGIGSAMRRVQPVVAQGRIFISSLRGDLICIDTGDRSLNGPRFWADGRSSFLMPDQLADHQAPKESGAP